MTAARVIVTAATASWARIAGQTATGYGTSVIGCDAEAGIERELNPDETPDGQPGVSLLFFSFGREKLEQAVFNRVGQCILTCPSTACYNGLPIEPSRSPDRSGSRQTSGTLASSATSTASKSLKVGGQLRFFGDGWQQSKLLEGRRFWRIPVMDGEFLCEDRFGTTKGVAGGNFLILAADQATGLRAAEAAVAAIAPLPGVITPFPGGVVRSGSKVGSRYKRLRASTNDRYCPTLRGRGTELPDGCNAVYEIVIDGLDVMAVEEAMRVGVRAACSPGVLAISAGNYGGKLGPFHLHLRKLLE